MIAVQFRRRFHALLAVFLLSLGASFVAATSPQKTFILTGEASGDYLGAWYLEKIKSENHNASFFGIGGPMLAQQNVQIYKNYTDLSLGFVGLFHFLNHLPDRWRLNKEIAQYVIEQKFTHVTLVDCPLTNLPLMRKLKKENPTIHITYVAPPELWIWGKWWIDSWLKSYCDRIVVIYPFEVEWYREQGLNVEWQGYPFAHEIRPHLTELTSKEKKAIFLAGSRRSELATMLPILSQVITKLHKKYPELGFITLRPTSIPVNEFATMLRQNGLEHIVRIIDDTDPKKYKELSSCCFALCKPGTSTLLLGLLQIPTIITYRVPWLTYLLAKMTIQVPYISLPNLLLKKEVCKELVQSACTPENIAFEAEQLYEAYAKADERYQKKIDDLRTLKQLLRI